MFWELDFTQDSRTSTYEDNYPTIDIVNFSIPSEMTHQTDVRFFTIHGWKEAGDIIMNNIPGIVNPADDLTETLGWVLNYRHARYMPGNYNISFG